LATQAAKIFALARSIASAEEFGEDIKRRQRETK
jgi:hypothetical protein